MMTGEWLKREMTEMNAQSARRDAALELQQLAIEFEAADLAAFRRIRVLCWLILAIATAVVIVFLIAGGDWRYMLGFWLIVQLLTWGSYLLSARRQKQQTDQLKQLSAKWMADQPSSITPEI